MARGIVLLARSIGLEIIAEGLETQEQLRIGRTLDFDYVQGYHFSRPVPAEDIPALLRGASKPFGGT